MPFILAQNLLHSELTHTYPSIRELSKDLTVDRSTVRRHLKGDYSKLYKNQWKFSLKDFNF
jgi:DNA-binding transcriptional regulator YhcF (GntR family)